MKNLLLSVPFLISLSSSAQDCPVGGDKDVPKFQHLDSLKNRSEMNGKIDKSVSLDDILTAKGDDEDNYEPDQLVSLTGYIILAKYGGAETCNCHSKNKDDLDIHIELALHPKDKANHAMVCEINRYVRVDNDQFTLANIRKLVGKKVTITGYLFFDEEHKQNAVTTNPKGKHNWRYTCWEVHPVFKIENAE